jgi:hypothetical protein
MLWVTRSKLRVNRTTAGRCSFEAVEEPYIGTFDTISPLTARTGLHTIVSFAPEAAGLRALSQRQERLGP